MAHPHLSGNQVASMLYPVKGFRDQQRRNGKTPIDYMKKNHRLLKETEKKMKEVRLQKKNQENSKPVPFKLKKFQGVQSKLSKSVSSEMTEKDKIKKEYLRKGEGRTLKADCQKKEIAMEEKDGVGADVTVDVAIESTPETKDRDNFAPPVINRIEKPKPKTTTMNTKLKLKDPVPKANDLNKLAPRTHKNFISNNYRDACENRRRSFTKHELEKETDRKHSNFGKVPMYLLEKKKTAQREQEAKLARELNGEIPEGMVVMDGMERLRTLETLQKEAGATQKLMDSMPLRIETDGQKRRMKKLEDALKEQNAAVEIFSRDRVLIYQD